MKHHEGKRPVWREVPGYYSFEDAAIYAWNAVSHVVGRGLQSGAMTDIPDRNPNMDQAQRITESVLRSDLFRDCFSRRIKNLDPGVLQATCYAYNLSHTLLYHVPRPYDVQGLPDLGGVPARIPRGQFQAATELYADGYFTHRLIEEGARHIGDGNQRLTEAMHHVVCLVVMYNEDQARDAFAASQNGRKST